VYVYVYVYVYVMLNFFWEGIFPGCLFLDFFLELISGRAFFCIPLIEVIRYHCDEGDM